MQNYWNLALMLSLLFHGILLVKLPPPLFFTKEKIIEKDRKEREIKIMSEKIDKIVKEKVDPISEVHPLPYVENIMDTLIKNTNNSSQLPKPNILRKDMPELILSEIPPYDKQLKRNPAYMNYYRLIREKIRNNAYRYYSSRDTGKILLSFVVFANGQLGPFSLSKQSTKSVVLQRITLQSIRNAAPFPPFPKELQGHSHLTFRIPIYYQNN